MPNEEEKKEVEENLEEDDLEEEKSDKEAEKSDETTDWKDEAYKLRGQLKRTLTKLERFKGVSETPAKKEALDYPKKAYLNVCGLILLFPRSRGLLSWQESHLLP